MKVRSTVPIAAVAIALGLSSAQAQDCSIDGKEVAAQAEQLLNRGLESDSEESALALFEQAYDLVRNDLAAEGKEAPASVWIAGRASLRVGEFARGDSLLDHFEQMKPGCSGFANQVREQVWAQQYNAGVEEAEAGDMMVALEHFENANMVWSDARSLSNAASIFENSGMPNSAEKRYEEALEVAETEEARSSAQSGLERIARAREPGQAEPSTRVETSTDVESEYVNGFHGYEWGTPLHEISEIAGSAPVDQTGGLDMYAAEISLLGTDGSAWFLIEPSSRELIQGLYHFELTIANCERRWAEFETALDEAFPALRKQSVKDPMTDFEERIYDDYCEFYAWLSDQHDWATRWSNPSDGSVELGMQMLSVQLKPVLGILYSGDRAQTWQDRHTEADKSILGPVQNDTTDGGQSPL